MSSADATRYFRLFDRRLVSDTEIHLLDEVAKHSETVKPDIRLVASEEPVALWGEPIFGGPEFTVTQYDRGGRGFCRLERTGHVAVMEPDGLLVTIRPEEGWESTGAPFSPRRIADTVVTGVLNRLPILWGSPAIHGALLETPAGAVLILGQSGNGKSTLSQILQREHGWVLHDDDTVMVNSDSDQPCLIPMGAAPRIRQDAAKYLQLTGAELPGYHGGKLYLSRLARGLRVGPEALSFPIAIFELSPAEEVNSSFVEQVDALASREALWSHALSTNTSKAQRARIFKTVESLALSPFYRVHYRQGFDTPEEVAALINQSMP